MDNTRLSAQSPLLSSVSIPSSLPLMTLDSATQPKKPQVRCGHTDCKKKLLLSDFECKCGARYCSSHRYPQEHACIFDFKAAAATTLGKQLVKCAGDRMVDKI
jgi:hypothetical protein